METLHAELVETIARVYKLTLKQAIDRIEHCITAAALKLKIDYNQAYNEYMGMASTKKYLISKNCSKKTIDQCDEMDGCVWYKNACRKAMVPDSTEINRDPDAYTKGMSTKDLTDLVEFASYLYYNLGHSGLTDNGFDGLEYMLRKRLKTKERLFEKVGAPVIEKLRIELPYPMPSLPKVKPGTRDLTSFLTGSDYPLVWSHKLDGMSGMVVYSNGTPVKLYSRGDGEIGGDLSYALDYIKFPTINQSSYKNIVVRGEFIISNDVFDRKYKGLYSIPRSFVVSKLNAGVITPGLQDIEFIAYHIVDNPGHDGMNPSEMFNVLPMIGFTVVPNGVFSTRNEINISILYKIEREKSEYSIDGLVIVNDEYSPDFDILPEKLAFKMVLEDQIRDTIVTNVDWNISRHGRYSPVAVFESVFIDGIRIHRASAFNGSYVKSMSLGEGTHIKVFRSGDVIPQIKDVTVDETIKPIYPTEYPWSWKGKFIFLNDIEGNKYVQIKRSSYFFNVIGVSGIREGTLERFYDAGYKYLFDVTNMERKDMLKIKGIGQKKATSFYTEIHEKIKHTRIDRFMVAITHSVGIGRMTVKKILAVVPDLFIVDDIEKALSVPIKGIGKVTKTKLVDGVPKIKEMLVKIHKNDTLEAIKNDFFRLNRAKDPNDRINGKTFVFTGFLDHPDYDIEDYIYDNGGTIGGTVTSGTEALVAGSSQLSKKMTLAYEFGVPIYTTEEFKLRYIDYMRK